MSYGLLLAFAGVVLNALVQTERLDDSFAFFGGVLAGVGVWLVADHWHARTER